MGGNSSCSQKGTRCSPWPVWALSGKCARSHCSPYTRPDRWQVQTGTSAQLPSAMIIAVLPSCIPGRPCLKKGATAHQRASYALALQEEDKTALFIFTTAVGGFIFLNSNHFKEFFSIVPLTWVLCPFESVIMLDSNECDPLHIAITLLSQIHHHNLYYVISHAIDMFQKAMCYCTGTSLKTKLGCYLNF